MAIEVDIIGGLLLFLGWTAMSFVATWFISKLFFVDSSESKKGEYGKDTEPEFTADDFMGIIIVNLFGVTLELFFFIPRAAVKLFDTITQTIPNTPNYLLILFGACVATGMVVYQPQIVKTYWGFDQVVMRPIFDGLINQLINIARLFANLLIPSWNFIWRMFYVSQYEVPKVLFTCEVQNWRATAEAAAFILRNFTADLKTWSQNNPLNSRVNFINTFTSLGNLVNSTSGTVICFAEDLYPFYAAFVNTTSDNSTVTFLNYAVNIPFAVIRVVFKPLQERGNVVFTLEPLIVEIQGAVFWAGKTAEKLVLQLFIAWWGITTDPNADPPIYIIQRFFQSPWSEPVTGVANAALGLVNTTTTAFLQPLGTFSPNCMDYIQTDPIFSWLVTAVDALGDVVQSIFFEISDVDTAVAALGRTIVYAAKAIVDIIVQYLFTLVFINPEDPFVFFSDYLENPNAALNQAMLNLNGSAGPVQVAISQLNEPLGCTTGALLLASTSLVNSSIYTFANIENILTGQAQLDQYVNLTFLFGDTTLNDSMDGVLSEMLPRCLGDISRQFTPNPPCESLVARNGSIIESTEFTDVFCALGNTLEYGSRSIIVIIGEVFRIAVELLSGAVFSSLESIAPRLRYALSNAKAGVCQLVTTIAAVIPESVQCTGQASSCAQVRTCLANFLCSLTNVLFVPLDVLVQFIEDLVDSFTGAGTIWNDVAGLFAYIIMSVVTAVTNVMRQFGNLVWCGTGLQSVSNIINDIADAIDEIANIITEAVIELFKTLVLLITSITNPTAFFNHLTSFLYNLFQLILGGLFNIVEQLVISIFDAIGMDPIGHFIASLLGGLCSFLQGVLDVVVGVVKIFDTNAKYIKMCCGGPGQGECKPNTQSTQGSSIGTGTQNNGISGTNRKLLSSDAFNETLTNEPRLLKTFLTDEGLTLSQYSNGSVHLHLDDSDLMKFVHTWNWTGLSECDIFVSGSKNTNISNMTPLEKGFLVKCLTDRAIGMVIHAKLPFVDPDILTNRWRKWMIMADIFKSSPLIAMYSMERMLPWEVVSSSKFKQSWKSAGYSVSHLENKQDFEKSISTLTLDDYFAKNKMPQVYAPSKFLISTLSKGAEIAVGATVKAFGDIDSIFDSEVMKRFDEKGKPNDDYNPLKVAFAHFMSAVSKIRKGVGLFWNRMSTTETTVSNVVEAAQISTKATFLGAKWLYDNFDQLNFTKVDLPRKEFAEGIGNLAVSKVSNFTSSLLKPNTEEAKKNRETVWLIIDGVAGAIKHGLRVTERRPPSSESMTLYTTGRKLAQSPTAPPSSDSPFFSLNCVSGSDYLCHHLYIIDQIVGAVLLEWNQTVLDYDTRVPIYIDEFEDFAAYSSDPTARVRIGNAQGFVPFYFPNRNYSLSYYLGGYGNSTGFSDFDLGMGEGDDRGLVTKAVRENAGNVTKNPLVSTIYWMEYFSKTNITGRIDTIANSILISDPAAERGPGGRVFGLIEGFVLCNWNNATQCFTKRFEFGESLALTTVIFLGVLALTAVFFPVAVTATASTFALIAFVPVFLYITYGRGILCGFALPECVIQDATNFLFYTVFTKCPWLISGLAKDPGTTDTCYGRIPNEIWNCMEERHFYTIFDNAMYMLALYAPDALAFIETTRSPLTNLRRLPYFGDSINYFYNVSLHMDDDVTYTSHGACNIATTPFMTISASGVALILTLASPLAFDLIKTLLVSGIVLISNFLFFICFTFLQVQVQYVHKVPIRWGDEYLSEAPGFPL